MFGRNRNKPDTKRYVREHGTGVTAAGIERALKLLPAMRAIGDPDIGSLATEQDLKDVKSCLEAYQKEGKLFANGIAGMMWSDMGVFDSTDRDAVDRLQDQTQPDGTSSKYRFVFQSVPLAMTPSMDLMHPGWQHLLSDMCGRRNMEEFVDQAAAGAYLATVPGMDKGTGTAGMARKLAEAWKGLDEAAPCTLDGAENSARMMQFCALQAAAYLDGYDFMPDEAHAAAIGRSVAGGFQNMEGLAGLIGESLAERGQPQKAVQEPAQTQPAHEAHKPELWTGAEPGDVLSWRSRNPNMHGMGMASYNDHKCLVTGKAEDGTLSTICVVRADTMKMRPNVPVTALDGDGFDGFVAVPSEKMTVTPRQYYDRGMYGDGKVSDKTLAAVSDRPHGKSALAAMQDHLQQQDAAAVDGADHEGPEI